MSRAKRYWDVMPALLGEGSLLISGTGQLARSGRFLALCRFFDHSFRDMARKLGAEEHEYPALIPVETLRRLGYFSSFPQLATFAAPFKTKAAAARFGAGRSQKVAGLADPKCVLSPAVCYHTHNFLRGKELPRHPYCVTAAGNCFRFEGRATTHTPERLWDFTMREIVVFGSGDDVERVRRSLMSAVRKFSLAVGISGSLEEAADPFFLGASRGQLLIQRLKKLKYELKAAVRKGAKLALASFNHHEDFFGRRMEIRLSGGGIAHSGCVAFGIERWAYAFLCQNGLEPRRWPARVTRYLKGHETR